MSADTPNTFIQATFPREPGEDRAIVKITGRPVDVPVNMHPERHKDFVAIEKGKWVLCAETLKAICGMLEAALC